MERVNPLAHRMHVGTERILETLVAALSLMHARLQSNSNYRMRALVRVTCITPGPKQMIQSTKAVDRLIHTRLVDQAK